MNQAELEAYLREFPTAQGWGNTLYGLDDLDFQEFIQDLAAGLIVEFRVAARQAES